MENLCNKCCCIKQRADLMKKHVFKKYPEISSSCNPDNIKWENLAYGRKSRQFRACINWCVAILLIIASLTGVILMKSKTQELKAEYNTNVDCPADSKSDLFKVQAWRDQ